jgi:hypothetical protein
LLPQDHFLAKKERCQTYPILPVAPRREQAPVPVVRLRPGIRHRIPRRLPTRLGLAVPAQAPRGPDGVAERGLDAHDVFPLGLGADLGGGGLAFEDGAEDAEGVVDGVFDG